jgi:hypothetical protein
MIAARGRLRGGLAVPIVFAAIAVTVFVALGTWQLQRRVVKLALIETLDRRLSAIPVALPDRKLWPQLDRAEDEHRRVRFSAAFVPAADALVYAGPSPFPSDMPGAGYWVFALARTTSGDLTPLESMPAWLATVMQASPSTHFVSFAQSILYRGAGIDVVWPQFLTVALIGGLFFGLAILRFRAVAAQAT